MTTLEILNSELRGKYVRISGIFSNYRRQEIEAADGVTVLSSDVDITSYYVTVTAVEGILQEAYLNTDDPENNYHLAYRVKLSNGNTITVNDSDLDVEIAVLER